MCIYLDLFPYYTSQEECLEIFNQTMLLGALIKALAYLQNFVSNPQIVIICKQTSRCWMQGKLHFDFWNYLGICLQARTDLKDESIGLGQYCFTFNVFVDYPFKANSMLSKKIRSISWFWYWLLGGKPGSELRWGEGECLKFVIYRRIRSPIRNSSAEWIRENR